MMKFGVWVGAGVVLVLGWLMFGTVFPAVVAAVAFLAGAWGSKLLKF